MKLLVPLLVAAGAARAEVVTIDIYNFTQLIEGANPCNDDGYDSNDEFVFNIMNDMTLNTRLFEDDNVVNGAIGFECHTTFEGNNHVLNLNGNGLLEFSSSGWEYWLYSIRNLTLEGGNNTRDIALDDFPNDYNGCQTPGHGGAVRISYAEAAFENVVFRDNTANYGGAVTSSYDSDLTFKNVTFEDNVAISGGGGAVGSGAGALIEGCTFRNNTARLRGGAIFAHDDSCTSGTTVTIVDTVFENNNVFPNNTQEDLTELDLNFLKLGPYSGRLNVNIDCASSPSIYSEYNFQYFGYEAFVNNDGLTTFFFSKTCNAGAIDFSGVANVTTNLTVDVTTQCDAAPAAVCNCSTVPLTIGTYQEADCGLIPCTNALANETYTSGVVATNTCATTGCSAVPDIGTEFTVGNNNGDCSIQACDATTGTYYTIAGDCVTTVNCTNALANETYTSGVTITNACPATGCASAEVGTQFTVGNDNGDCSTQACSATTGTYYTTGGDCETTMPCSNVGANEEYVAGVAVNASGCPTGTIPSSTSSSSSGTDAPTNVLPSNANVVGSNVIGIAAVVISALGMAAH